MTLRSFLAVFRCLPADSPYPQNGRMHPSWRDCRASDVSIAARCRRITRLPSRLVEPASASSPPPLAECVRRRTYFYTPFRSTNSTTLPRGRRCYLRPFSRRLSDHFSRSPQCLSCAAAQAECRLFDATRIRDRLRWAAAYCPLKTPARYHSAMPSPRRFPPPCTVDGEQRCGGVQSPCKAAVGSCVSRDNRTQHSASASQSPPVASSLLVFALSKHCWA
jgi:hypothetical protein